MRKLTLILVLIMMIQIAQAQTIYTTSSKTTCNEGLCNVELYSGIRFVYENKVWKPVEKAKSLKDKFKLIVEEDSKYPLKVIDYNYTTITIKPKIKDEYIVTGVPYTIKDKDDQLKDAKYILPKDSDKEIVLDFSIGDELKFGFGSTNVTLQEADTENLDDSYINQGSVLENNGGSQNLRLSNTNPSSDEYILIKFNITDIPVENVTEATLGLYLISNGLDNAEGYTARLKHLYSNYSWTEGGVTYSNGPATGEYDSTDLDTYAYDNTDGTGWYDFNTTGGIINEAQADFSLYIIADTQVGSPGGTDYLSFASKENSNADQRPYLNISYSGDAPEPPADTTNPAISNLLENPPEPLNFTEGQLYTFNATITDETALDTVLFQWEDTNYTAIDNGGDIYGWNFTNLTNATYNYRWIANDSSNNLNVTTGTYTIGFFTNATEEPAQNVTVNITIIGEISNIFNTEVPHIRENKRVIFEEVPYMQAGKELKFK